MLTDVSASQLVPCAPARHHRGNSVSMALAAGLPFKACAFLLFLHLFYIFNELAAKC